MLYCDPLWVAGLLPAVRLTGFDDVRTLLNSSHSYREHFAPAYVAKLGRGRLMAAPAWSVEQLDDGGILYILG